VPVSWRRAARIAYVAGPYAACVVVLWRMASWEQAIQRWVAHGQRVFDAASNDLAVAATELHEDAVERGAAQN
jgi:hypothetical protein